MVREQKGFQSAAGQAKPFHCCIGGSQWVRGADNVASVACSGPRAGRDLDHSADYLGVLDCAEIIRWSTAARSRGSPAANGTWQMGRRPAIRSISAKVR